MILAVLVLLVISVTFIYTASSTKALDNFGDATFFLKRQIFRILIGAFVCYLGIRIDYHEWLHLAPWFFWGSLTLLLVLVFAPGEWTLRSTRRWLLFMGFRFQPSELAKLGLILLFSKILAMKSVNIRSFFDGLLPQLILLCAACGMIMLQPDAGTALMIFFIAISILFLAGARIIHLFGIFATGLTAASLMLLSVPYQRQRLVDFWTSFTDYSSLGWQVKQSLISLGNGGLFGVGLGNSQQKMHWLPDPFTDFIYSIIGEELGLPGTIGVIALLLIIVYRGFRIAFEAPDKEGQLLAAGLTLAIGFYGLMNVAVVTHLLPTTGIPMPFISYGGSSLIVNMFGIGILINICEQGTPNAFRAVTRNTRITQKRVTIHG